MNAAPKRTTSVDQALAELIKNRRIALGLTQQQLGELIGVTYQQAHKYERAMNRISVSRLLDLCRVLGIAPAELLADVDATKPRRRRPALEREQLAVAKNLALLDNFTREALVAFVHRLARRPSAGAAGLAPEVRP